MRLGIPYTSFMYSMSKCGGPTSPVDTAHMAIMVILTSFSIEGTGMPTSTSSKPTCFVLIGAGAGYIIARLDWEKELEVLATGKQTRVRQFQIASLSSDFAIGIFRADFT